MVFDGNRKIVLPLATLLLPLLLSACGGFRTISYANCVPETIFTSTREHVIYLIEAVPLDKEILPASYFKISDDEYYLCTEDRYGKSKTGTCSNLPMFAVEEMPIGTNIVFDGLVVKNIPWGEEALWNNPSLHFRGHVGERTVWASPVDLRSFSDGELPDEPNENGVKRIGLASESTTRSEEADWTCP